LCFRKRKSFYKNSSSEASRPKGVTTTGLGKRADASKVSRNLYGAEGFVNQAGWVVKEE